MKFVIPVRVTGVKTYRVDADTLEAALEQVDGQAKLLRDYELMQLGGKSYDVLAPTLMLRDDQLDTWPHWAYGWHGTDGCDWRQYTTDKGKASIPDLAEEFWPIPAPN